MSAGKDTIMEVRSFLVFVEKIIKRICKKEWDDRAVQVFIQFVKFGIVGLSNTVISYALYSGGLLLFRKMHLFGRRDYLAAQAMAFVLSVLWSFYWNNRFVFAIEDSGERPLWKALLKTYVSYSVTGLFLSGILLVLWVRLLHISEFVAPVINLLVTVPLNFIMNKPELFTPQGSVGLIVS